MMRGSPYTKITIINSAATTIPISIPDPPELSLGLFITVAMIVVLVNGYISYDGRARKTLHVFLTQFLSALDAALYNWGLFVQSIPKIS